MSLRAAVISVCAFIPVLAGDGVESLPLSKEQRVDNGGVVYPADKMNTPEARRKAEILAKKIKLLEQTAQRGVDFSAAPISDVIGKALSTESNEVWHAAMEELAERPDEAKSAISDYFQIIDAGSPDRLNSVQLLLTRLPKISGALGSEYQRDIVSEALFHHVSRNYDSVLLSETGILRYLETSEHDETNVLDLLIAQGRLEEGSDLESNWRRRLASVHAPRPRSGDMRNGLTQKDALYPALRQDDPQDKDAKSNGTNWFLVVTGIFVVSVAVILVRAFMRMRAS